MMNRRELLRAGAAGTFAGLAGRPARAAEDEGFESAWVGDHIVWPRTIESQYPFASAPPVDPTAGYLESLTMLSVVAGATSRLRLGVGTLVLPLRHPLVVAKTVATLDVLSQGRVELAVGAGWMKEEFELTGQDFHNRGARMDEMLEVIAGLNRGGMFEYHGKFYDFEPVQMSPVPTEPVPVYIGGHSKPALRRRHPQ